MTFIIGASAHGSPGVSTALQVMAAQWPNADAVPVVVEADAGGGVLAARFEVTVTPGMVTLVESLRKYESPVLLDHAQRLPSGVACVPLSPSATAAAAQLRSASGFLGPYLRTCGHPVLLDAGSLLPDSRLSAVMTSADLILWFVRPTREEVLVLKHRLAETAQPDKVGVVLVGEVPYNAQQVSEALDVPVVHVLPIDQRAATAVNIGGDDRYLRRSLFARSCAQLTDHIQHEMWVDAVKAPAGSAAPVPPEPAPLEPGLPEAALPPGALPQADDYSHLPPPPPPPLPSRPPSSPAPLAAGEEPPPAVVDLTEPEGGSVLVWRPDDDEPAVAGPPDAEEPARRLEDPGEDSEPQPVVWFPESG